MQIFKRWRSALLIVLLLLIGAVLGWHHFSEFQWQRFYRSIQQLDQQWLWTGAFLSLLSYWGRAVRWKFMMWPAPARLNRLFSATLIGFAAVVLLGRAGEPVRPVLIAKQEHSTVAAQLAIWFLERLYDLLVILVLFGVALMQTSSLNLAPQSALRPVLRVGGGLATAMAAIAAVVLYLLARHPEWCQNQMVRAVSFLPDRALQRVSRLLQSFLEGSRSLRDSRVFVASVLSTLAEWSIILGAAWCYFHSYPDSKTFTLTNTAVYLGFVSLGSIVQLPGIGGGVQVASVVVLTQLFHLSAEAATLLTLLIWAGASLIVLPFAVPLAIAGHIRISDFRRDLNVAEEISS